MSRQQARSVKLDIKQKKKERRKEREKMEDAEGEDRNGKRRHFD